MTEGKLRITPSEDSKGTVVAQSADTGTGIASEHIDRIFEPFFSTKDSGDGTGLGLSISYRIIQNHGGRTEKGTVFRIYLPQYQKMLAMSETEHMS